MFLERPLNWNSYLITTTVRVGHVQSSTFGCRLFGQQGVLAFFPFRRQCSGRCRCPISHKHELQFPYFHWGQSFLLHGLLVLGLLMFIQCMSGTLNRLPATSAVHLTAQFWYVAPQQSPLHCDMKTNTHSCTHQRN